MALFTPSVFGLEAIGFPYSGDDYHYRRVGV